MRSPSVLRRTIVLLAVALTVATFLPLGTASAADRSSGFDWIAQLWEWLAVWNPAPVAPRVNAPAQPQPTANRGPIRKDGGIPIICSGAAVDPNGICAQGLLPHLPNMPIALGTQAGAPSTQ